MTRGAGIGVLLGVTAAAAAAACVMPPIPQNPAYHGFAGTGPTGGVPNTWAVLSNLPFVLVGLAGFRQVLTAPAGAAAPFVESRDRWPSAAFFAGVSLSGVGSAHYHSAPDHARLVRGWL